MEREKKKRETQERREWYPVFEMIKYILAWSLFVLIFFPEVLKDLFAASETPCLHRGHSPVCGVNGKAY